MKYALKLLLISFLMLGYTQVNAGVTYCDVGAAADLIKADGEKKKADSEEEEEEEPECD